MPVAQNGVLDLSRWDPARDGPLALDGQWEFYWDRLLTPDDFKAGTNTPAMSGYLTFPGFWKGHALDGHPLPGTGQATFRLRLLPGPDTRHLVLRLFAISAAYRLWANGKLLASSGVVGRTAATETPDRSLVLATLACDAAPVELVLQVSNHYFDRGGLRYPLQVAAPGQLERAQVYTWCLATFFSGCLLVMAIYHFVLYFLRKKDASTLYFGLYSLTLIAVYVTLDSSGWIIRLFIPNLKFTTDSNICLIGYAMLASILYRFFRSIYPKEFFLFVLRLCDIRNALFILIILTQPGFIVYTALKFFAISTFALSCFYTVMLTVCCWRGRDGARVLFFGNLILAATSLCDIYFHVFSINGVSLLPVGLLDFVLSQALALAQRFSNAFAAVENLSQALEVNNVALEAEMDERNRLEREIINVSDEERRRLSHDLHDGLCQLLSGTRLRCSVLERRVLEDQATAAEVSKIASLLEDSVSQAYDLSRGLWPAEHAAKGAGPSLEELAQRVSESSGLPIDYVETLACPECANAHVVQLFRIAQEAVANAVKHAKASRIVISLACEPRGQLTLTIRDDGIGRDAAARSKGGLGLRIMLYRARMVGGRLRVDDGPRGGTVVTCSVRCAADDADSTMARAGREDVDGQG